MTEKMRQVLGMTLAVGPFEPAGSNFVAMVFNEENQRKEALEEMLRRTGLSYKSNDKTCYPEISDIERGGKLVGIALRYPKGKKVKAEIESRAIDNEGDLSAVSQTFGLSGIETVREKTDGNFQVFTLSQVEPHKSSTGGRNLSTVDGRAQLDETVIKEMKKAKILEGESYKIFMGDIVDERVEDSGPVFIKSEHLVHMGFVGASGSGKTSSAKAFLYTVKRAYPETVMYFMDGSKTDMAPWAAKLSEMPIGSLAPSPLDQFSYIGQVVDRVWEVFSERRKLCTEKSCVNSRDYTKKTKELMPLVFLVFDEFGAYLESLKAEQGGKDVSEGKGSVLSKLFILGKAGRAFGVHMIIATQQWTQNDLPKNIRTQFSHVFLHRLSSTHLDLADVRDFESVFRLASKNVGRYVVRGPELGFEHIDPICSFPYFGADTIIEDLESFEGTKRQFDEDFMVVKTTPDEAEVDELSNMFANLILKKEGWETTSKNGREKLRHKNVTTEPIWYSASKDSDFINIAFAPGEVDEDYLKSLPDNERVTLFASAKSQKQIFKMLKDGDISMPFIDVRSIDALRQSIETKITRTDDRIFTPVFIVKSNRRQLDPSPSGGASTEPPEAPSDNSLTPTSDNPIAPGDSHVATPKAPAATQGKSVDAVLKLLPASLLGFDTRDLQEGWQGWYDKKIRDGDTAAPSEKVWLLIRARKALRLKTSMPTQLTVYPLVDGEVLIPNSEPVKSLIEADSQSQKFISDAVGQAKRDRDNYKKKFQNLLKTEVDRTKQPPPNLNDLIANATDEPAADNDTPEQC